MDSFLYRGIKLTATKSIAGKTACNRSASRDHSTPRTVISMILALPVVWLQPRP
ncbi:hypothetical protein JJB09_26165 [Rhizobium sp. KVB221]|uniref:Uncharacterized protein n=1 Tax=Rhizobium setariae TaxID=2801340 RepID=A0A936YUR1_9HYPH|nr:hypothetical protein [Rhizobium setariae]MBL0375497.1 hypothetical protein [Rhizobium setariae]